MPAMEYNIDSDFDAPDAKVEYTIEDASELMRNKQVIKDKMWYE